MYICTLFAMYVKTNYYSAYHIIYFSVLMIVCVLQGFLRILGGEKLFPFNQLGARVSFPAALFTLNEKLSQSAACLKLSVNAMR